MGRARMTPDEQEIELARLAAALKHAHAEIARLKREVSEAMKRVAWLEQQRSRQMDLELGPKA